jgi:TRAP-type transport system periplasmic protein
MKFWKSLKMISFSIILLMVLAACSYESGGNGDTYVLKYNHVLGESEPFHQAFLNWAEAVEERTDGGLKIEIYPSAQLGLEEDIIEQLKEGANVGQNTDSGRLAQYVPEIAVMNAPYFVDSIEEVEKLKELPTVQEWLKKLEDEHGIKVLSFNWVQGECHMFTNKPIKTPADLEGLRIRTPGAPIWQESIKAIGATPVSLPFGEVYVGMQQGSLLG